ncbi:hypothetical protein Patl1_20162 [Pistacia atlantica]|uniref:Uncharacterized protein n=1 Tax=Pistacia atlantica TaxID=434234 RepID=A0ACC1BKX9_9ROSI|nr:hypothetical protein Patl1_20162 [Pistacia atlantica]
MPEKTLGDVEEEHFYRKHRSITLGSIKEFNFDNTEGEVSDKPAISSEWWANEKVVGKEARPSNNWTFFPVLQSEVMPSFLYSLAGVMIYCRVERTVSNPLCIEKGACIRYVFALGVPIQYHPPLSIYLPVGCRNSAF